MAASMSREVEQFLYHEARLMDENRYSEWAALWTDDAIYWVPCRSEDRDPSRQVSIIYDNRTRLADRIARLESGTVLAQDPKPSMRRVVSNIVIENATETEIEVSSNFVLIQARGGAQYLWAGRSEYRLRKDNGALKIAFKKVLLVNSEQEMPVLQFLI
jgi:3-phenylpropionate/cinnamic acid dioxygenase small subunit